MKTEPLSNLALILGYMGYQGGTLWQVLTEIESLGIKMPSEKFLSLGDRQIHELGQRVRKLKFYKKTYGGIH